MQRGTREPLGQLLVNMGLITPRDRARALSRQWGIPFFEMHQDAIDPDTLEFIPKHLIHRYRVLPITRKGNRLVVAMVNPLDIFTVDQLRLVSGLEIDVVVTIEEDLNAVLANMLSNNDNIDETIKRAVDEIGGEGEIKIAEGKNEEEISIDQLSELVDDAPVIQLVNMILRQGLSDRARATSISNRRRTKCVCAIALTASCRMARWCPSRCRRR